MEAEDQVGWGGFITFWVVMAVIVSACVLAAVTQ